MNQIRAFICVEMPSEVKNTLKNVQNRLKQPGSNTVKWVDPANIHLTLKFLGNVNSAQINTIIAAMERTAQTVRLFQLQLGTVGAFPDINRAQVIWVGLKGDLEILLSLQKNLDSNLTRLGFLPEKRPFAAHLTLGRLRETATSADKQHISKSIQAISLESGLTASVNALSLMQSQLLPGGPVYTRLNAVPIY